MPPLDLEHTLEKLRAEYAAKLPARLKAIEDSWKPLRREDGPAELRAAWQREIHKLAGDAGAYGYDELGQVAGEMDQLLLAGTPPAALESHLARLRQAAARPPRPMAPPAPTALQLAASDKKLGEYLLLQWNPLEANWKALQWAWDNDTFNQFCRQLHVLHDNAHDFGFGELRDVLRHADRWLSELGGQAPSAFQLSNLNQQMQGMEQVVAKLRASKEQDKPFALVGRDGQPPEQLRLAEGDPNLRQYLLLQARQAESLWKTLQWNWHSENLQNLRAQLLTLSKNALACDLSALGRAVQEAGEFLLKLSRRGTPPSTEEVARTGRLIAKLAQTASAMNRGAQATEDGEEQAAPGKLIYVVDDDEDLSRYLGVQLQLAGFRVRIFNRLAELSGAVRSDPPDALIVDIMLAEGDLAGPRAMFQLQKGRAKPLPVLYMSSRKDMQARLAAARAHGGAYFTKPLNMNALLDKLEELAQPEEDCRRCRLLLVDDTADNRAQDYARALQEAGFTVKILTEPLRLLDALEKYQPRLLLIHSHLEHANAIELGAVARQDERYSDLPIIFYATRFGDTWKLTARFKVGDAMLGEDTSPGQLLATVTQRLQAARPGGA